MKRQILLALFFSFTYLGLNAQCNIPFPPATTCASAPIICELDGYCTTTTPGGGADQPTSFCGSVQNNQWFAFVAGTQSITLDFIVGNCNGTPNGEGLQAHVYSACGVPWPTASNCLFEIAPFTTGTLNMNNLTVGQTYYLMTDGFSGDICDYTIEVAAGSATPPAPDPPGPIAGDLQFCAGGEFTYSIAPVFGAGYYEWTLPSGATIIGDDDGESITIDFGNSTGGQICVTPLNDCNPPGAQQCINVTLGPPITAQDGATLCPGETYTVGMTTYSTTGTFLNTDNTTAQGCIIETTVDIVVGTEPTTNLAEFICQNDPPIIVGSTSYNVSGNYTQVLQTSLGCDSTVNLDLTVMNPIAGAFQPPAIDCGPNAVVNLEAVVSNPDPSILYNWSGPCVIVNIPGSPTAQASCPGLYTLQLVQTLGGVTCFSDVFSVTVDDNTTPPFADPGAPPVIDCDNPTVTLGGQNSSTSSTYGYSWVGPNGFVSSEQFPTVSEQGEYCFFMIDLATLCVSPTNCITVTGDATVPTAVASASNDLTCAVTSATLQTAGSTPGSTFSWTDANGNQLNGANPSVSDPGTYTLTVTGANGCTSTSQTNVNADTTPPTAVIDPPATIDCINGTVTLNGANSTGGNLDYTWSGGGTPNGATLNVTAEGTYTLVVTNTANGCTDEASVTVNNNTATITGDVDVQGQITCVNGNVTLTATNVAGTNNPTYQWTDANGNSVGTGVSVNVSSAGTYTLIISDNSNGCASQAITGEVTEDDDEPTATASVSGTIDCNNASVVLSSAGSTTGGNITTAWTDSNGNPVDPNNISTTGIYTLTVTNTTNGCDNFDQVQVTQNTVDPVAVIDTPQPIDCNNPTITLNGSNSTGGNLSYSWAGGVSVDPTLEVTTAGTYTLTVVNLDNGCSDEAEVVVEDNSTTVVVEATAVGVLTCTNGTSSLEVTNLTGSNDPQYTWTNSNGDIVGTTPTTPANAAGVYTLVVVDGTTGCENSTSVTVLEDIDPPLVAVANPEELTCVVSTVTIDGSGSASGNNITYQWFEGGNPLTGEESEFLTVTTPGNYTLVVTDNDNGCTAESLVADVVLNDVAPVANAVAGNGGVISCTASSLTIDGTGSTGNNISYEWTDQNGNQIGTDPTVDISSAGDYFLVVTNGNNGCTADQLITIDPDADTPGIGVDPVTTLDCNNSVSILSGSGSPSSGGTITVTWSDANGDILSNTETYEASTPGSYTFTVTDDGNGCTTSQTIVLNEDLENPISDAGPNQVIDCDNAMVTLNGSNSTSGTNVQYQWFDEAMSPIPGATAPTYMTNTAGIYSLQVTFTNSGCTALDVGVVTENTQGPVIDAAALNNIDCNNDEATMEVTVTSSFSNNLTYQWSSTASGGILGTDPSAVTSNEGAYEVLVTDLDNGCTAVFAVTVQNTIADPMVDAIASDNGELNCNVTQLSIDGSNSATGTNISYQWQLGGTDIMGATDAIIDVSDFGTYTLVVSDSDNGCTSTIDVPITEDITAPDVAATSSTPILTCTDPVATLDGAGSSIGASFSYAWLNSNGDTVTTDISDNIDIAGTYTLIVTNNDNGCTAESAQVVIDQSSDVPVAVIDNVVDLTCDTQELQLNGANSTAGGTIEYQWTDAQGMDLGATESIMITEPGQYNLEITDLNNGCIANSFIVVEQNIEAPAVDAGQDVVIDCNQSTTTLDGSASALDPNITYTFQWSLGADVVGNDLTIPDVGDAGTYELLITNTVNGCTSTSQVTIDENFEEPVADAGNAATITCGQPMVTLDGSASSANGNFTYTWLDQNGDTASTTITEEINTPGIYTLVVTNEDNGCTTASTPVEIAIDVDLPALSLAPAPTITCFNNQEVTLDGSASATGADIEYAWIDPNGDVQSTSAFYVTDMPGEWIFQVANTTTGCVAQETLTVDTDLDAPLADAGTGGTLICGQASFTLDGGASSTGANFSYQWLDQNNNIVGTDITFDAGSAGLFVLAVTNNDNGCSTVSAPVQVDQDANIPTIDIAPLIDLTCAVGNITVDGSASASNVGSTLTYEWTDANGMPLGGTPTIDVTTPGPVTLTIIDDSNNCSATQTVTVVENVQEPLANAGVGATLLCGQTEVLLDGGGSASGAEISYEWIDPNGNPITGVDSVLLNASTPGTYTLVVTDNINGCIAASQVVVDQDVNLPTATVDFSGILTCDVDEITVDGSTSSSAGGGILEYQWSTGTNNPEATFETPGSYSLTVIDPTNNCESTIDFLIEQDITEPTPEISIINATTISCAQQSLVFNGSNSTPSSGTALSYEWFLGTNPLSTLDEVEIDEAGALSLVVTNVANGCSATTSVDIDADETLPMVNIANPETITCLINEIELDGTGSSVGANFEYSWTGPAGIGGPTSLNPTISNPGQYTLLVTNTDNGCENSATVIVNASIDLPIVSASATDQFDCITTEVTLTGDGSSTGSEFAYEWTTSNGTFVSGSNSFSPTISAPGNYTLIVTNTSNGCTNATNLTVTENLDVPFITDFQVTEPNCFGENNASILVDGVAGGQLPYLYSINGSAFAPINQFSFLTSGEYNIMVQDANGCEDEVEVIVNDPQPLLVELGNDITIGLGDTIDLQPQIVGSYDTLFWTNCIEEECLNESLEIGPVNTSQYSLTVIDGNGCVTTDEITVFVEKGREVFIPNAFSPNGDGDNDRFWIFAGQEAVRVSEFRVFNRWGEQVYEALNFDPKLQTEFNGWDGRMRSQELNPGVFVYYAKIEFLDGRVEVFKGDVALRK
ncbi:MAG: gliding motility-associated C-terminal domain-containing protein [Bacteroidota bacterium]